MDNRQELTQNRGINQGIKNTSPRQLNAPMKLWETGLFGYASRQ
jgi:hypothetical protein